MGKTINELFRGIRRCRKCERCRTRRLAVPGEGAAGRRIVLLGEAPGKTEDQLGRPFVGRTGRYLDKVFAELGIARDGFFITSILKCYHPEPPRDHQIEACRPWTVQQIAAVRPRAILVMGLAAAAGLLGLEKLVEEPVTWEGITCVVTVHPAAGMRFPKRNARFRCDLDRVLKAAKGLG